MKNLAHIVTAALVLATSSYTAAHEFWLQPAPFSIAAGGTSSLSMFVGEYFSGERVAFTPGHAAAIQVLTKGGRQDVRDPKAMRAGLPALPLSFPGSGTHVLAFDSAPSILTLSADKFHAYLHEEGLDAIIRAREQDGTAATPGRERYRRNAKTLIQVGKPDAAYAVRTGQRLEIVPLADPLSVSPGDTLGFRLMFDDQPLPDALVKAWHKKDGQVLMIRARTDVDGRVRLTLPHGGAWMISTVHMIPASGSSEVDWDSFWGNLTFELAGRKR